MGWQEVRFPQEERRGRGKDEKKEGKEGRKDGRKEGKTKGREEADKKCDISKREKANQGRKLC